MLQKAAQAAQNLTSCHARMGPNGPFGSVLDGRDARYHDDPAHPSFAIFAVFAGLGLPYPSEESCELCEFLRGGNRAKQTPRRRP